MSDAPVFDILYNPPVTEELRGALLELWADVANAGGAVGFAPPVTIEGIERVAGSEIDAARAGRSHLIVGAIGDEPIGFLFLTQRPGPLSTHWATVKRLQVHPTLQEKGIGAALLDGAAQYGKKIGLMYLHLTVRGGTGTEGFYERHGYEVVGRIPAAILIPPRDYRDELYLVKRL